MHRHTICHDPFEAFGRRVLLNSTTTFAGHMVSRRYDTSTRIEVVDDDVPD